MDMETDLQNTFRALADNNRRTILIHLCQQPMTIAEVCQKLPITRTAVKKHLTILEEGKLISVKPHGRERINTLEPHSLKHAMEWLGYFSEFWDEKLSKLSMAVEQESKSHE